MTIINSEQIASAAGITHPFKVVQTLTRHGVGPSRKDGKRYAYLLDDVLKVPAYAKAIQLYIDKKDGDAQRDHLMIRKIRSDKGRVRKADASAVALAVELARSHFLSSGIPDARLACEAALRELGVRVADGRLNCDTSTISIGWFYRRYIMRKDDYFVGPYHADGWLAQWRAAWRQHDVALEGPYSSRSMWQILENAGWAGPGYGFGWCIVFDDRDADVICVSDEGSFVVPKGIYAWDYLTGALLWVEPCEEVTTQAYIRAVVGAWWLNALSQPPLIVMENSSSAKGVRISDVVKAIYTHSELAAVQSNKMLKNLMGGQAGPVYRNVPHIARDFAKAAAERGFLTIKREHDASFSATTFKGGDRKEAVQLHRSNQVWWYASSLNRARRRVEIPSPTVEEYWRSLYAWSQGSYLERERGTLNDWARRHKQAPTRKALVEYYGGCRAPGVSIPSERLACLIYASTPQVTVVTCRAPGRLTCIRSLQTKNLVSADIGAEAVGRKVGVVPVPGDSNAYICVLLKHSGRAIERFLAIAHDFTATSIESAAAHRREVRAIRSEIDYRMDETINEVINPLRNTSHFDQLPELPPLLQIAPSDVAEGVIYEESTPVIEELPIGSVDLSDDIEDIMDL